MSAIRSALDEMLAVSDDELSLEELAADIGELTVVGQMVEVLVARKTKSFSERGGPLAMRAITARDRHCQAPGCQRPPRGATSTTSTTGPTAERPRWKKPSSSAGSTTPSNTSNNDSNDTDAHQPRGGTSPTTPQIPANSSPPLTGNDRVQDFAANRHAPGQFLSPTPDTFGM